MSVKIKDIPKENIFGIGIVQQTIIESIPQGSFHFANPRKPFIVNRAEALNIIGYLICHGEITPSTIDLYAQENLTDLRYVNGDESRAIITGPQRLFVITRGEALELIGRLIQAMHLHPSEIDASVISINEQANGQTMRDIGKHMH